jgi:predicted transcriptional regulator
MPLTPLAESLLRAASWPSEAQAERAAYAAEIEAALTAAEHIPTPAERTGIDRGLADARAGRFATPDQLAATFARHRPA